MKSHVIQLATVAALACGDLSSPHTEATYRFVSTGSEEFLATTADTSVISRVEEELAKVPADRYLHINGEISREGTGANLHWSWSFIPGAWDLTMMSAEVCDGKPSDVEANLGYWVDELGRFCPWRARVVGKER